MTINVAPGTYNIPDGPATVENPITIVGGGAAPGEVTIRAAAQENYGGVNYSVFTLNNAQASLSNLRVADGFIINWGGYSDNQAAGVWVKAGTITNYGQRIKSRFFPLGAPESFLMRWKCLSNQQPAAQQPIRVVVARQAHRRPPGTPHRTRPTVFLCVGIEPTLRWFCPACGRTRC